MSIKLFFMTIYFACFFLITFGIAYGQEDPLPDFTPKLSNPSANDFTSSTLGNTSMSPFTGRVSVNIPLYQRKMGPLDFNMSAVYIGGNGKKVQKISGSLGYDWLLNVSGSIVRHKRGLLDQSRSWYSFTGKLFNGISFLPDTPFPPDGEYLVTSADYFVPTYEQDPYRGGKTIYSQSSLWRFSNGTEDPAPDLFEFNFNGNAGKFYIGTNGEVIQLKKSDLKITRLQGGFLIVDTKGNKYHFTEEEVYYDNIVNWDEKKSVSDNLQQNYGYHNGRLGSPDREVNSWLLKKVEDAFSKFSINYEYYDSKRHLLPFEYVEPIMTTIRTTVSGDSTKIMETKKKLLTKRRIRNKVLKSIVFSDEVRIDFNYYRNFPSNEYNTNETELREPSYTWTNSLLKAYPFNESCSDSIYFSPKLKTIKISRQTNVMNEYFLGYKSLFSWNPVCSNKQDTSAFFWHTKDDEVCLESIKQIGTKGDFSSPYTFEYTAFIPYSYMDHWGFMTSNLVGKDPSLECASMGMLSKITYPKGGFETFEYELNSKYTPAGNSLVGGLRIKKHHISNGLNPSSIITREYKYVKEDGMSSGFLGYKPFYSDTTYGYKNLSTWSPGSNIMYIYVRTSNLGTDPLNVQGTPVGYSRVEEIISSNGNSNGRTVYEYSDLNTLKQWNAYWPPMENPFQAIERPDYLLGLPLKINYYAKNGNPIKQVVNKYQYTGTLTPAVKACLLSEAGQIETKGRESKIYYGSQPLVRNVSMVPYVYTCYNGLPMSKQVFKVKTYIPEIGNLKLVETTERLFSPTVYNGSHWANRHGAFWANHNG